jgi:ketosteroid isomerase-like protein
MAGNLATLEAIHEVLIGEGGAIATGSPEQVLDVFREVADPEFECRMVGPDLAFQGAEAGPEGFLRAWAEWLSPFEDYRIEVEKTIEAGDVLVDLVHQTARTKRGGVPVETRGAAVWRFRDGRLAGVEFHLDRSVALRSAGLDPGMRERPRAAPGQSRQE